MGEREGGWIHWRDRAGLPKGMVWELTLKGLVSFQHLIYTDFSILRLGKSIREMLRQ